jgi:hypothetical protein
MWRSLSCWTFTQHCTAEELTMRVHLSKRSRNSKTGPIPVSTTSADTCPDACPLKNGGGCYAEANFHLRQHWSKVTRNERGSGWGDFCDEIAALPDGQLWRHNQAGDLPGEGNRINTAELGQLVAANKGKRGFTYTHKPMTPDNRIAVTAANAHGFTVNLSANNVTHADELAELEIAPVVVVLASTVQGNVKVETPAGRRVVVCPATYREDITCASCGLCQVRDRKVIVGFPAHGAAEAAANHVARSE